MYTYIHGYMHICTHTYIPDRVGDIVCGGVERDREDSGDDT